MMHSEYMNREAAITVRIPPRMKQQLEICARRERRSLSGQIATYLERGLASEPGAEVRTGRLLGLYQGTSVPTERDFAHVRRLLWAPLAPKRSRHAA